MRKLRILIAEVVGLGLLIAWLMWKYPDLIDDIIPWVALLIAWHLTWEFVLDTKWCRHWAIAIRKQVNKVWLWVIVFLIGGMVSVLYWAGINKSLMGLASLAAERTATKPPEQGGSSVVRSFRFARPFNAIVSLRMLIAPFSGGS